MCLWRSVFFESVFSACHSRQRRSECHDRGKCLRQAWINMLRQDTEILPLSVSLTPSHTLFLSVCPVFSLFQFSHFSCFNPAYYWHYLLCLQQKAGHLWFLNTQEAQKAIQTLTTNFNIKWTPNPLVFRLQQRVYAFTFLLDSLYTEFGGKVSLTDSLLW